MKASNPIFRLTGFGMSAACAIVLLLLSPAFAQENEPPQKTIEETINEAQQENTNEEVVGGRVASFMIFRETVALAQSDRVYCSGVLIDEFAVLTAAHCVCEGQLDNPSVDNKVFFGVHHDEPRTSDYKVAIDAEKTKLFASDYNFCAEYDRNPTLAMIGQDIALIFLKTGEQALRHLRFSYRGYGKGDTFVHPDPPEAKEADNTLSPPPFEVAPARIATDALYLANSVSSLYVVGFGLSQVTAAQPGGLPSSVGRKMYAKVRIESKICGSERTREYYRCAAGREAVLIDASADACAGDSGGPVFVYLRDSYFLVGLTSRAVLAGNCGAGGIYSLITPRVMDWLRKNGVTLHSQLYPVQ